MDNVKYAKLTAKAWSDPQFVQKLFSNPSGALSDVGIDGAGVTASIVLMRGNKAWLNVNPKPATLASASKNSSLGSMEDCSCHVAEDEVA